MSTQGLVTFVHNGQVVLKVVAGCNGQQAEAMADFLRVLEPDAIRGLGRVIYGEALRRHFGCRDCLVVLTPTGEISGFTETLPPRYRQTFNQPEFNPRWPQGTAAYVEVIKQP